MPTALWRQTIIAVIPLTLAILLINPLAEVGMNDDWSYVRTAFDLARSGHLRYNGWAAPIIGFQAYWGALFVRLFGYSFTVVRISTEVLTLLFVPVLLRLCRTAGLHATTAMFATLTLLLSPLLLISLTSFMTDTPAFLLFAGALLAALEAWQNPDRGTALRWMLLAAILGALSGSIRQIYWAAGMWFLFVLAGWRFKSAYERSLTWLCLLATLAFSVFVTQWQRQQPYVPAESLIGAAALEPWRDWLTRGFGRLMHFKVTWIVLLLPVSVCFLPGWRTIRRRWIIFIAAVAAGGLAYLLADPLPWAGNTLSQFGVLSSHLDVAGEKPLVLSPLALWLIATASLTTFAVMAVLLIRARPALSKESLHVAVLTLPFLLVYIAAIAIRGPFFGLYDRYAIPVIMILSLLLLSACKKLPAVAWIALGIYALYGVATGHDSFSAARARLEATKRLLAGGVQRTHILSGFEFDCWTQVEQTGYINSEEIQNPANAYHDYDDCNGPAYLQYWWRSLTPSVHALYLVTLTPIPHLEPPSVRVTYRTWLPFGTQHVYAQPLKEPLTCKPSDQKLN
jgi:hypothetical protein